MPRYFKYPYIKEILHVDEVAYGYIPLKHSGHTRSNSMNMYFLHSPNIKMNNNSFFLYLEKEENK